VRVCAEEQIASIDSGEMREFTAASGTLVTQTARCQVIEIVRALIPICARQTKFVPPLLAIDNVLT